MKKNLLIVVFIIIILGLSGYLVWDKVISNKKLEESKSEAVETTTEDTTKITSYEVYSNNLSKSMNDFYAEANETSEPDAGNQDTWKSIKMSDYMPAGFVKDELSFELKTNGDVYINMSSFNNNLDFEKKLIGKYGEKYKVASDVLNIETVEVGNGGCEARVFLIKKDGSVSSIDYNTCTSTETKKFIVENNYKNLKNIVSIVSNFKFEGRYVHAIDIDGNDYILNDNDLIYN